ncbi:MAG: hypothetical protein ACN4GR_07365 [Arenicellales bacterium]
MRIVDDIIFISFRHLAAAKTPSRHADIEFQLVVDASKVTSRQKNTQLVQGWVN